MILAAVAGPSLHLALAFASVPHSPSERTTVRVTGHHNHRHHGAADCPCCDDAVGCAVCGLACANGPALLEAIYFGAPEATAIQDRKSAAELSGLTPSPEPHPPKPISPPSFHA